MPRSATRAVTISHVAERAGVAPSTVSEILNGRPLGTPATRERVRACAAALGYRPNALARGLRRARAGAIGLVIPFSGPIFAHAYLADVVAGIQAAQAETGINLLLAAPPRSPAETPLGAELATSGAVDGILIVATRMVEDRDQAADALGLAALGCPQVWIGYRGTAAVDVVERDQTTAWRSVLARLAAQGHRRVGFLSGYGRSTPWQEMQARQDLLGSLGLEIRPAWCAGGDLLDGGAMAAALALIGQADRPSALVCAGDDLAVLVLEVARRQGLRIPQDLALASLCQHQTGRAAMALTSHGPSAHELGRQALLRLLARIDQPGLPAQRLRIGGSLLAGETA